MTVSGTGSELLQLAVMTVVCVGYAAYLVAVLRRKGPANEMRLRIWTGLKRRLEAEVEPGTS